MKSNEIGKKYVVFGSYERGYQVWAFVNIYSLFDFGEDTASFVYFDSALPSMWGISFVFYLVMNGEKYFLMIHSVFKLYKYTGQIIWYVYGF